MSIEADGIWPRRSGEYNMNINHSGTHPDAFHATLCSFLGLSARDLAELGGFSERFARDLLAGRRPFPSDVKISIELLLNDVTQIAKAILLDLSEGERTIYIYRTNDQLRASPVGGAWPTRGAAAGGFVGPYRAAVFNSWLSAQGQGIDLQLVFAERPAIIE
jgi:hypothetical protein